MRGANRTRARVPPISHSPSPLYRVSLNVRRKFKLPRNVKSFQLFFSFLFLFKEINLQTKIGRMHFALTYVYKFFCKVTLFYTLWKIWSVSRIFLKNLLKKDSEPSWAKLRRKSSIIWSRVNLVWKLWFKKRKDFLFISLYTLFLFLFFFSRFTFPGGSFHCD